MAFIFNCELGLQDDVFWEMKYHLIKGKMKRLKEKWKEEEKERKKHEQELARVKSRKR